MKKKLFILCIIIGVVTLFLGIRGFIQVNTVRSKASQYSEMSGTYKSDKNYWETLHRDGCDVSRGFCYCEKATNVDECVDEYLNDTPQATENGSFQVTTAKNRYVLVIISIVCFVGSWVFHEKKESKS